MSEGDICREKREKRVNTMSLYNNVYTYLLYIYKHIDRDRYEQKTGWWLTERGSDAGAGAQQSPFDGRSMIE